MQFKSICFEIYFNQCFLVEKSDQENYELKIMWRIPIKEKYIISRWNFLCMPVEVYSAHVFNNSFGRVPYRDVIRTDMRSVCEITFVCY